MTVTSASRPPRLVAAERPPNPAPIITMCGRAVAVEARLSSAAGTRSMIPSISSPHRRSTELRNLPGANGHDVPMAFDGNRCERDDDEAQPGAEAEAFGREADNRRPEEKSAIASCRYCRDPDARRHGGELAGGAEEDRHRIGKPQSDGGKPEQHCPAATRNQPQGQENGGGACACCEHGGRATPPYRPVSKQPPGG